MCVKTIYHPNIDNRKTIIYISCLSNFIPKFTESYDESGRPAAAGTGGLASQISADVVSMKRRRQCSLEWEFIATILDRIFLIAFTLTVVIVTAGMMVTGRVAQAHYEQLAREIG